MIQRIQTVYLLLAACLMLFVLFVPVSDILWDSPRKGFYISFSALASFMSLYAISLYKNRKKQIRYCWMVMGWLLLFYVVVFLSTLSFPLNLSFLQDYDFRYTIFFPLIAMLFTYLAVRGIKKDEKLVRSTDRIR